MKLTGTGEWPLADHLEGVLWLPYKEPLVLQHNLPVTWDGPNVARESYEENLALLKVWSAKGLLALFAESHPSGHVCRAFNAHKSALIDRQIGDRRWFNGSERHPSGPSAMLPAGSLITSIHAPRGTTLFGCTSDRRDFYHQSAVTRERVFTNIMPFSYPVAEFSGTPALRDLYAECGRPTRREVHGDRLGMQPRSVLHQKNIKEVYAGFNSLFQGDHLGVEFALQSHSCLLRDGGLLNEAETILRGKPFPTGPVWQGVVIDDFFTVSCDPAGTDPKTSKAVDRLNTAEKLYAQHSILGSDEKTVRGDELFKIIGAEVNSTKTARDAGIISVAAPLAKRVALSALSLRAAKLPCISRGLASRIAGNWISVMMFRRCLTCLIQDLFKFANRSSADVDEVVHLDRKTAQELTLCAVLSLVAQTDATAPYDEEVYAIDASLAKGAYTVKHVGLAVSRLLWLCGDKKGSYTSLDLPARAQLRAVGCDLDQDPVPEWIEKPSRAPDLHFDAVEICGGSGVLTSALSLRGLVCSAPIDLSRSSQFDVCDVRLLEWVLFMLSEHRLHAVLCEPPCTTFSAAQHPSSRSYQCPLGFDRKDVKTLLGNTLAFRCLTMLWFAHRIAAVGLLEQPRLSKMAWLSVWKFLVDQGLTEAIVASCNFGSPHKKEFKFLMTGIDASAVERRCPGGHKHLKVEGKYTKASAIYTPELCTHLAEHIFPCSPAKKEITRRRETFQWT